MTSTVIDVTVFLLCVSAGVVTLSMASGVPAGGSSQPVSDAGAVADIVATSTATVTYDTDPSVAGSAGTNGTHHATLAELLATAVAVRDARAGSVDSLAGAAEYDSAVVRAVLAAVGDRTQVLAYRSSPSPEDVLGAEAIDEAVVAGREPPPDVAVDVATIRVPSRDLSGANGSSNEPVRIVVRVW